MRTPPSAEKRHNGTLHDPGGTTVVVADIDAVAGRHLVDTIEARGGQATFVLTDASDVEEVRSLIRQAPSWAS